MQVRPHPLAQEYVVLEDRIDLLAEGPDLVRPTRHGRAHPRVGLAVPVEAEQRAECAVLEPAHKELAEPRVLRVPGEEAPYVRGPPWDAAHCHVEPRPHLHPERVKCGRYVT